MSAPRRVACELPIAQLGDRRERWRRLARTSLAGKAAIPHGARLRYRWSDEVERELRALVALERECCSFALWFVGRRGRELSLEVTADGDGVAAVRGMFDVGQASKTEEVSR